MSCGEGFPGDATKHQGGQITFDACCTGPLALTWDGREWRHWCSAFCAAFGRHVSNVKVSPDGLTWETPRR